MLAKRKSAGGSGSRQEVFAIKAVSQENVCHDLPEYWSIVEKLVFICAVGHQFLVQLYSFFETKVLCSFVNVHVVRQLLILKFTKSVNV
jgi:hypothetical protein